MNKTPQWENRFRRKFVSNGYVSMEDGDLFEAKEVKAFIKSTLEKERKAVIEEVINFIPDFEPLPPEGTVFEGTDFDCRSAVFGRNILKKELKAQLRKEFL